MPKRMNPLDARWLLMESADTPMHVGALAIFAKPRNAPANYLTQMAEQMRSDTQLAPPWNYRLRNGRYPTLLPALVEEKNIELDYHFRHFALPAPGGEREFGMLVSKLHSESLDRDRPLWEFHLIEGLENNRFAIYAKLHHCMVEGLNAIPAFTRMLSPDAKQRDMPPLWGIPGKAIDDDEEDNVLSTEDVSELAGKTGQSVLSLGKALNAMRRRVTAPLKRGRSVLPLTAPRSTLNRAINRQRRFTTQQYDLDRVKQVATATDSTIDDILVYLCGSALRRFFKEYNALPKETLVGLAPIDPSKDDKSSGQTALLTVRVSLGTDIADPIARLHAVQKSVDEAAEQLNDFPSEATDAYAMLSIMPMAAGQVPLVGRLLPQVYNLGISSIPGPEEPLYFNGARMEALYPMSILTRFAALMIAFTSYDGTLNVGFTGARDTLPHLQRLAVYMAKALEELEEIVAAPKESKQ